MSLTRSQESRGKTGETLAKAALARASHTSGVSLENDGTPVAGGPFATLDLAPGLTATSEGGGVARIAAAIPPAVAAAYFTASTPALNDAIVTPTSSDVTVGAGGVVWGVLTVAGTGNVGHEFNIVIVRDAASQTGAPGGTALGPAAGKLVGRVGDDGTWIVTVPFVDSGLGAGSAHAYALSLSDQGGGTLQVATGAVSYAFLTF